LKLRRSNKSRRNWDAVTRKRQSKTESLFRSLAVIVIIWVSVATFNGTLVFPPVANASSALAPSNAVVVERRTSLQLPSGAQLYIYGFVTGGSYGSLGFINGQYASVINAGGKLVASLAVTSNNTNSFRTQTGNHVIGGVSVSGYSSYTSSFGSSNSWGAPEASTMFAVQTPGSLAVIFALGGLQRCMTLIGISGMQIDAASPDSKGNSYPLAMTIAHAYLNAGTYTVTEQTRCRGSSASMSPDAQADLIAAFIFVPAVSSTSSSVLSQTQYVTQSPITQSVTKQSDTQSVSKTVTQGQTTPPPILSLMGVASSVLMYAAVGIVLVGFLLALRTRGRKGTARPDANN